MKTLIEKLRSIQQDMPHLNDTPIRLMSWSIAAVLGIHDAANIIERLENEATAATIRIDNDALTLDKHCVCEFEGDENTVQCALHNAWAESLNEQATYRRERVVLNAQLVECRQRLVDANVEVDDLNLQYNRLFAANEGLVKDKASDRIAFLAMRDERDALLIDAARYQLVKTMSRAMSLDIDGLHYWHIQLRGNVRGPTLDAAIDAAMKEDFK